MGTDLLSFWISPPSLIIKSEDSFPLAAQLGIEDLFSSEIPLWDSLREFYEAKRIEQGKDKPAIYIKPRTPLEWREIVLTLGDLESSLSVTGNPLLLHGFKLDSFSAQAQRRGVIATPYLETHIASFTRTANHKIILGIRGDSPSKGQVITAPAGAVKYDSSFDDSISRALFAEQEEELGVLAQDTDQARLIAIYRQRPGTGAASNIFLYKTDVQLDSSQIIERHSLAMDFYNAQMCLPGNRIELEIATRRKMKELAVEDKTFPVDAWENISLIAIDNTYNAIMKLALEDFSGRLSRALYGGLALYVKSEFGDERYRELIQQESFREKLGNSF